MRSDGASYSGRPCGGSDHARLHRLSRDRDQHLLLAADRRADVSGHLALRRRCDPPCAHALQPAAAHLARACRGTRARGRRGPLRLRSAGRADDPPRLRGLSRPNPRAGHGRAAARLRARQHARRHGGGGLRRLRGRPAGPPARDHRSGHGARRRARPPLPHHAADAGGGDGAHHLQGVSPHRHRRAGGGSVPALSRGGPWGALGRSWLPTTAG